MRPNWLKRLLTGFIVAIACSLPSFTHSVELPELEWCLDDYPSRHNYPAQGQPHGPTVDFMLELARKAGIRIRFSPNTPFARCLVLMANGQTDLMTRLNTDIERERYMYMIPLQKASPEVLLIHKNSEDIQSVRELNKLNLIVIRGYTYNSNTINVIAHHPRSIIVDSIDVGLAMLLRDRGDALVTTAEIGNMRTQNNPEYKDQFKLASLTFSASEPRFIHLALSKASPHAHLKDRLENAVALMIADGLME